MNRFVLLLVAILFVTDGYNGKWTEYRSGSFDGIVDLIHMDENQTVSIQDPKFKQGVIDWVYDQLGPTLMETYYQLPLDDQKCIYEGYTSGANGFDNLEGFSELLKEELPEKSMKYVESNCPTLNETAAVLYKASYAFFMKQKEQVQNFTDDLPESMRSALVKMYNITMMLYNHSNDRHFYPYGPNSTVIVVLEACEEFLNAPEEDRKTAAKNDTLWTSLFTGDLHDSSLELVRALKKFLVIAHNMTIYKQNFVFDREAQDQDVDKEALITTVQLIVESLSQAWRKWLKIAKSELLAYFETRTRPWNACLEDAYFEIHPRPWSACPYAYEFSRDLGNVYNHNYMKWFDWYA